MGLNGLQSYLFCPENNLECRIFEVISQAMDALNIGLIILDHDKQKLKHQNKYSQNIFRNLNKSGDFIFFYDLFLPQPLTLNAILLQNNTVQCEKRLLHYRIIHPEGALLWLFFQDITEKSRLESIAEAVNLMDNIGYIFSGLRHEICNPVNNIKTILTVLKAKLEHMDQIPLENIRTYVERTLEEIVRLEELLKLLRNFNMFDDPKPENIDLMAFFGTFMTIAELDALNRGIKIKTDFSFEARYGYIDSRALHQAILNVFTNALDALVDCETPEIRMSLYRLGGRICIKIKDNGSGIPRDQLKNLFNPFFTTKEKGTGLGLVITRNILTKMNSTIEIQSEHGQGTTVYITMPEGHAGNNTAYFIDEQQIGKEFGNGKNHDFNR